MKNSFLLLAALLLMAACDQRSSENLEYDLDNLEMGELVVSSKSMSGIIQNLASPLEVAALINSLNIPFSSSYLANPDKISSKTTSLEMAYSIGALSGNLGYLNMYDKTGAAINYLSGITRLADALQIGGFFDFASIKRLAGSSTNRDSLMYSSIYSFNEMDNYLRKTGRSNLSALMITGGWLEGLHLATQVALQNNNEDLIGMIGEQKLILNAILQILKQYSGDLAMQNYISDLELIKELYSDVHIAYEKGEPETIEKDGMLLVVQSEKSVVMMNDDTLKDITEATEEIRNKHLNIKS